MAGDQSTRDGIKTQIKLACEEELGDVVLRLSTEDAFDLLCDLVSTEKCGDDMQWLIVGHLRCRLFVTDATSKHGDHRALVRSLAAFRASSALCSLSNLRPQHHRQRSNRSTRPNSTDGWRI